MHVRRLIAARLADRLDRLQATFAALNTAVRDKVAEVVGKTAEDLVRQTVRAVLEKTTTLQPESRPASETGWWDDDRDAPRRPYDEDDDDRWPPPAAAPPPP